MAQRVPFVVGDLGADAEPFMLHLYAALAERNQKGPTVETGFEDRLVCLTRPRFNRAKI